MSREINKELMHQIYDYIEEQWYFNNKRPVKKSLQDISDYLKSKHNKEIANPMILYYVRKLADSGKIKYSREDVGNNANIYEILEWGNEWLNEEKNENEKEKENDEIMNNNNQLQFNNLNLEESIDHIKKTLGLIEKLKVNNNRYEYLTRALKELIPIGETIDGFQLFKAKKDWNIIEILNLMEKTKKD